MIDTTVVVSDLGYLLLACTERGVCSVRVGSDPCALERELETRFPSAGVRRRDRSLAPLAARFQDFVAGRSGRLDVRLDVGGSQFERRVWDALRRIPRGETRSYGAIARSIGRPEAARAVAGACARNPVLLVVPCHRAVAARGLGGYSAGFGRKRLLLVREGVRAGVVRASPSRNTDQRCITA